LPLNIRIFEENKLKNISDFFALKVLNNRRKEMLFSGAKKTTDLFWRR
jgi:hypothetical protein